MNKYNDLPPFNGMIMNKLRFEQLNIFVATAIQWQTVHINIWNRERVPSGPIMGRHAKGKHAWKLSPTQTPSILEFSLLCSRQLHSMLPSWLTGTWWDPLPISIIPRMTVQGHPT